MVDGELSNQIVNPVGLERSSSAVVMATFGVDRLDMVALLAFQAVKKVRWTKLTIDYQLWQFSVDLKVAHVR